MPNPKLTFVRRVNRGKKCIAPFIGRFNVWDIPEKEFTPEVEKAILHAYELGFQAALRELQSIQPPCMVLSGKDFHFEERN